MTTFGTLQPHGQLTDTLEIDLNTVPSSDPLAFSYGLYYGKSLQKEKNLGTSSKIHGSNFSELAPEYLRGFLLGYRGILIPEGTKIRKGEELSYFHDDKNLLK